MSTVSHAAASAAKPLRLDLRNARSVTAMKPSVGAVKSRW